MIDGLWAVGTLTEIIINVTQTVDSVIKMSAPVVLGDQKRGGLACPVNQRKKLFSMKGTRLRTSRWVQRSKNIAHACCMRVIELNILVEFITAVENFDHLIQESGRPEHVIVLTSARATPHVSKVVVENL
jgi:hypothetical protein